MGTLVPDFNPATVSSGTDHRAFPGAAWLDNPTATTHVVGERFLSVYRHGASHLTGGKIVGRFASVSGSNPWTFNWSAPFDIEDVANDLRPHGDALSVLSIAGTNKAVIAASEYDGSINLSTHILICDDSAETMTTTSTWTRHEVALNAGSTQSAPSGRVHKLSDGSYLLGAQWISGATSTTGVLKVSDITDWSAPTLVTISNGYNEIDIEQMASGSLRAHLRNAAGTEIYSTTSANLGTTWTAPALAFAGFGFPIFRELPSGTLLSVYRSAGAAFDTAWRYSTDGSSWTAEVILDATSAESSYATLLQLDPHHSLCVYSVESDEADPLDSDVYYQVFTDTLDDDLAVDTDTGWQALHEDDWPGAAVPAGWNDRGYDDSGWDAATVEGSPDAGWKDIPNADFIHHADADDAASDEEYLLRQAFTLDGTVETALLVWNVDNEATIYVNGEEVDERTGEQNYAKTFTVDVDRTLFRLGENVIAARVNQVGAASPNPTMFQAMLSIYYYDTDAVPGVWVDWDQDGFSDDSEDADAPLARSLPEGEGVTDNITPDVISIDWTRGAASDHVGQPGPGTCTIVVKNGANAAEPGKYTPDKTTSTLYGKLRPGLPVWIGRNADGTLSGSGQTVHGVWAGYVKQIVPLPVAGAEDTPTAEIICEGPFGYYSRRPTKVAESVTRSHTDLREAVLDDIGEPNFRRDVAWEVDTMPLSAAASASALQVLEDINAANGSRHSIEPADTKEGWYTYRVVTRHHKLTDATDFSLNADNIQSSAGYRVTEENVNNFQQIDVSPAHFPAGIDTVWTYVDATFPLTAKRTIWATFDDFVKDAALDYTSTGGAVTATFTAFGTTAKIELWSASSSVINNLTIEGRMVIRDASESVTAEDAASQDAYGQRAGPIISSAYVGTATLGQGVADFLVWKFGTARARMSVSVTNLLSTLNGRTLYDTLALTFDRLYLAGRRFEIIGEHGACLLAASASLIHWTAEYELQETPNQAALGLFELNDSTLNGSDTLAR